MMLFQRTLLTGQGFPGGGGPALPSPDLWVASKALLHPRLMLAVTPAGWGVGEDAGMPCQWTLL